MQNNFIEIALRNGCSPVNLPHISRTPFTKNASWSLLLNLQDNVEQRDFIFSPDWCKAISRYLIISKFWNVTVKHILSINSLTRSLFFSIWVSFHEHSRIIGLQGKGEGISLTPHYHFHRLHRHLDTSRAITAESSSPLHIASSRTRTGNLSFPGFRAQVANH